jgi:Escherichia/Staphylococcus phage prohead protease
MAYMAPEVRLFVGTEVRASVTPSGKPHIEGYAAVFNSPTQLPGFREVIKPGAFTRALTRGDDTLCLFNHDSSQVLGRTASGTLELDQDSRGLHYRCEMPNTQVGRDAYELIKRGDISGSSFGFTIDDGDDSQVWGNDTDSDTGEQFVLRQIRSVKLVDVSPVASPAYKGATVQARCAAPPQEFRAAVNAARIGFKMPTFDECLEITRRAAERKQHEMRMRRMNLMTHLIN